MDIERGILKALFYDYPIDTLIKLLDSGNHGFMDDTYLHIVPQLLRWRERCFTNTEADLMAISLQDKWKCTDRAYPNLYNPFDFLKELTTYWLSIDSQKQPRVKFDQLFRWKDAALFVGEDILTTAFLAAQDVINQQQSYAFVWGDIIHHDNIKINDELEKGITDTHAHFNASSDIFHLNWLCLMNNIRSYDEIAKKEKHKVDVSQDIDLAVTQGGFDISLRQMCIAAASLRHVFYSLLLKNQQYDKTLESRLATVLTILRSDVFAVVAEHEIQADINISRQASLVTTDGRHVDYCLQTSSKAVIDNKSDINVLYQGERALLYNFFFRFYSKDKLAVLIAPYFYLYILLKNRIRREFVQINELKGFENFEKYQDRKDLMIPKRSVIADYLGNITLQTNIANETDYIEVRLTPKNAFIPREKQIGLNVFGKGKTAIIDNPTQQIGVTIHFIKQNYTKDQTGKERHIYMQSSAPRYDDYRRQLKIQLDNCLKLQYTIPIVGIDAASTEMFCRPEVFGHVFRYAKCCRLDLGLTYHVGEDFYDIADGLRAIDEAVLFLQLDANSRIGHALAMGVEVEKYYRVRHLTAIMPQQNLLDNCVWLLMRSQEWNVEVPIALENHLYENAAYLFNKIGYHGTFDKYTYWHSMLLRGDEPLAGKANISRFEHSACSTKWEQTEFVVDERLRFCEKDEQAYKLFDQYHCDVNVKQNGEKLVKHKWHSDIVTLVEIMQCKLQQYIADKHISIECCPTSNLKIGYIDRYEQHPLLTRFYPIDKVNSDPSYPLLKVSINTDDRGVFYTSLYEEYSLIALALYKMKDKQTHQPLYNEREILKYIDEVRVMSDQMAFRHLTR